jgi:hypothetical protein
VSSPLPLSFSLPLSWLLVHLGVFREKKQRTSLVFSDPRKAVTSVWLGLMARCYWNGGWGHSLFCGCCSGLLNNSILLSLLY